MILHGHPLSGNTHKVRLLLAALGIAYEEKVVDVTTGAQKTPEFLRWNPRGQVPVLVDGDTVLFDGQAILVYLARKYDGAARWLPSDPVAMARVIGWLSFAANEVQHGVHLRRMHVLLGAPIDVPAADAIARASLEVLNTRLRDRAYLEGDRPTIADLACFPCVALAPEGNTSLADFPHVIRWIDRIVAQPFFVAMPGMAARVA